MTFASTIRFAAPLLLAATLAGCVVPYDDAPYSGGAYYGGAYYGGAYYGGNIYSAPYYSDSHYGGDGYATYPSRRHRTSQRDCQDGHGAFRWRQRAHNPPRLGRRHRRSGDVGNGLPPRARLEAIAIPEVPSLRLPFGAWRKLRAADEVDTPILRGHHGQDTPRARPRVELPPALVPLLQVERPEGPQPLRRVGRRHPARHVDHVVQQSAAHEGAGPGQIRQRD